MSKPFARYHAIMAAITSAMSFYGADRAAKLAQIPEYKSRGKGKSTGMRRASNAGNNCNNTSMLHDYAREKARRIKQKQFQNWLSLQEKSL
jgi:hypothetical protein